MDSLFITFEGLDFCGKTTQVKLLESWLKSKYKDVLVLREPGGTAIGELIREILLNPEHSSLTEASELFLFEASRSQLVKEIIRPALSRGTIVICDRYYDSTTAYQGYGRGISLQLIEAMNLFATENLVPNVTFFLDIPVEEIEKRMKKQKAVKDRMESNAISFYKKVREGYFEIAKKESRIKILDGLLSIEEIHSAIINNIQLLLHQPQLTNKTI